MTPPDGTMVLTESEIQDRLYGAYLGRRRPSPEDSGEWTGAEILAGELDRLRTELVSLRREKERLTGELQHLSGQAAGQHPSEASLLKNVADARRTFAKKIGESVPLFRMNPPMLCGGQATAEAYVVYTPHKGAPRATKQMPLFQQTARRWIAVGAVVCVLGYLGARRLQASPVPSAEPTPYTVQVAVYDVRPRAEQAMEFLRRLAYAAFLVEMPRSDGRIQYRIYVGMFVTKEEASLERMRLAGDPRFRNFKDAFVRIR